MRNATRYYSKKTGGACVVTRKEHFSTYTAIERLLEDVWISSARFLEIPGNGTESFEYYNEVTELAQRDWQRVIERYSV